MGPSYCVPVSTRTAAKLQKENAHSCVVNQDIQPFLPFQKLFCGRLGKFWCGQVKFQQLNSTIPWRKSNGFDTLDGVQTLLKIPCGEVDFSTTTGESFHGLQTESRTDMTVSYIDELWRWFILLATSHDSHLATEVIHLGSGVKFVGHDARGSRGDGTTSHCSSYFISVSQGDVPRYSRCAGAASTEITVQRLLPLSITPKRLSDMKEATASQVVTLLHYSREPDDESMTGCQRRP